MIRSAHERVMKVCHNIELEMFLAFSVPTALSCKLEHTSVGGKKVDVEPDGPAVDEGLKISAHQKIINRAGCLHHQEASGLLVWMYSPI